MAVISKDLGAVTAYAAAVNRGYTGTKEEFETLMASYATVAQQAQASATSAGQSATDASQSATDAETAKGIAQQAATDAQTAQVSAQESAQSAQQSAQSASQSAQNAELAKETAVDAVDGFAAGAQQALDSVNQAGNNWKSLAQAQKLDAEAWAVGKRDGEDVGSSDPAYHNNAKYYAQQTESSASQIIADATAQKEAAQQARQGAESAQALAETAQTAAEEAQTAAETAQGKAEEAAERADVVHDGTYDDMAVGSAKQLISKKMTVDSEPYLFRASGGQGADREYDEIVGGSIVWNQLIQNGNFADGADEWRAQNSAADLSVEDGVATVTLNTNASTPNLYTPAMNCLIEGKIGHVYLSDLYAMPSKANNNTYLYFGGNVIQNYSTILTANAWTRVVTLTKPDSLSDKYLLGYLGISNPKVAGYEAGDFIRFRNIQIYDLTQMFGSTIADYIYSLEQTTAGAGVEFFRKLFTNDYYDYNPGELMHVSDVSAHKMRDADENVIATYPLDSSLTLRGVPKIADGKLYYDGDRYKADGTVERRYGVVDLGTLDWTYNIASQGAFTSYTIRTQIGSNDIVCSTAYEHIYNFASNKLASKDKVIGINITVPGTNPTENFMPGAIVIKDSSYTDAESFKAAMSGFYLIYELVTPTTETADPYQSLQITDPYGTEEYVTTSIVPVGHETKYPENLRAKIEGLPWDFSSLIAPTENGTASRNYTVGSLLIMGNTLYKVTANIANGGAITPNTNVTATTLSEVISALA